MKHLVSAAIGKKLKTMTLTATIARADGTVEELGEISRYDAPPEGFFAKLAHAWRGSWREARRRRVLESIPEKR